MPGMVEAKADKKPKKELRHLVVKPAENGGCIVSHVFNHYDYPDEEFVFGKSEKQKAMEHIGKALEMHTENPGEEAY